MLTYGSSEYRKILLGRALLFLHAIKMLSICNNSAAKKPLMSSDIMLASAKESHNFGHNSHSVFATVERHAGAYGIFTNIIMLFAGINTQWMNKRSSYFAKLMINNDKVTAILRLSPKLIGKA